MSESIIPAKVRLAAKRAFVRTSLQVAAGTIPAGGVSVVAIAKTIDQPDPVLIVASAIAWASAPLLGGLVAALQVAGQGIPDEYAAVVRAVDADDPELGV